MGWEQQETLVAHDLPWKVQRIRTRNDLENCFQLWLYRFTIGDDWEDPHYRRVEVEVRVQINTGVAQVEDIDATWGDEQRSVRQGAWAKPFVGYALNSVRADTVVTEDWLWKMVGKELNPGSSQS